MGLVIHLLYIYFFNQKKNKKTKEKKEEKKLRGGGMEPRPIWKKFIVIRFVVGSLSREEHFVKFKVPSSNCQVRKALQRF